MIATAEVRQIDSHADWDKPPPERGPQTLQLSCPGMLVMTGVSMLICMPPASKADNVTPRVNTTPSSNAATRLNDQLFMAHTVYNSAGIGQCRSRSCDHAPHRMAGYTVNHLISFTISINMCAALECRQALSCSPIRTGNPDLDHPAGARARPPGPPRKTTSR